MAKLWSKSAKEINVIVTRNSGSSTLPQKTYYTAEFHSFQNLNVTLMEKKSEFQEFHNKML